MNNVEFNIPTTTFTYAIWVAAGAEVEINNSSILCNRGIKIYDEDIANPTKAILTLNNVTLNLKGNKPAVMVTSAGGADITLTNVNISAVVIDTVNVVWNDEARKDYFNLITVNGGTVIQE